MNPLSASAQGNAPSRAEVLVMKDNLLILWSMGLTKSAPKSQEALCRDALFFLILSEGSACGVDRRMDPDLFQGIPERYMGFVPKQKVEESARTIFGQEVSQHVAFKGSYFDGNGYFLDFGALSDKTGNICNLSPDLQGSGRRGNRMERGHIPRHRASSGRQAAAQEL